MLHLRLGSNKSNQSMERSQKLFRMENMKSLQSQNSCSLHHWRSNTYDEGHEQHDEQVHRLSTRKSLSAVDELWGPSQTLSCRNSALQDSISSGRSTSDQTSGFKRGREKERDRFPASSDTLDSFSAQSSKQVSFPFRQSLPRPRTLKDSFKAFFGYSRDIPASELRQWNVPIHPFSPFFQIWEFISGLLLLYSSSETPFLVAFFSGMPPSMLTTIALILTALAIRLQRRRGFAGILRPSRSISSWTCFF